ncbi:unnamed protein product, partial [Ixodes hexagonus]
QTTTCPGPSNLVVLKKAFNSADLRWDVTKYIPNPIHCVCNNLKYVTEYCNESVVPKTCFKSLGGYLRTVSSLSVYTNYTFCVQTQCADSNYSLPICTKYTTSPTAPSAPYQIFADKHSPSSLDISWRFPTVLNGPLDGYKIRWCYAPLCVFTEEHLEGANHKSYRIAGLEPYKEYQVYVSAYNVDNGKYLYGAESGVRDFTLPTYPSNPSMTFTKVSTSQVNVLIGVPKYPNGPISGYVLRWCPKRRCYGSNVGEREILQTNAGTQAVTGLQFWTEYAFSVTAFNVLTTNNARIYSDVVNDSVITMPFSPAGPQQFRVVALSAASVRLTWEPPVNTDVTPTHYRLFWCTKDNRFCFNHDVGNVREATIAPLAPWTTYTFMIKALVQFSGPWLNSQVSTATGRTWAAEPSRPTSLRITKQQATTVDVSWQMPQDPMGPLDGFRVRICPELGTCPPMGLISRYKTLNSKTLTHSFYGLEAYTNYQVQVRAFNSLPNGETAEGDVAVIAVTTAPSNPSQPTQLQVKALNSSALGVTWRPPSHPNGPVKGYQVTWWKTGGTSTDDVEDKLNNKTVFLPGDVSSFTITQLQAYKTYAVQVARINGDRNSTWDGAAAHAEGMTDPEPCPPPRSVSATTTKTNATSSKTVVSWAAPNGTFDPPIQGYFLHICKIEVDHGIPTEGKCQYSNTSANVFTFTFEGLESLADYIVAVSAYVVHDGRYIEGNEATESLATDGPPIPTVTNLNYTTSNGSTVNVSWSRVTGLEQYDLVYNVALYLTEDDSLAFTQNVNGTENSYEGLRSWTSYTVRVSACLQRSTKLQCGDPAVLKFETQPTGSSEPTNVEVNVVNSTAFAVTWEAPNHPNGPLSGYRVTWWKTSGTATLDIQERLKNETVLLSHDSKSFLLVGLEPYTTYVIEVVVINVVKNTSWTGIAARMKRTTDPSPGPPPTELSIERIDVNFSSCDIRLSWGPPNGISNPHIQGYLVRLCHTPFYRQNETRCFSQNTTENELSVVFKGANTFADYTAEVMTYIIYEARTIEGKAAVTFIMVDPGTVPTVDNMKVTAFNHNVVRVSWSEVHGLSEVRFMYNVRVYLMVNKTMIRNEYVEGTTSAFSDMSQDTNYTVTVAVCLLHDHYEHCGGTTATDVRTPAGMDQNQPTGFQASAVNSTAILVTWKSPKDSSGKVEDYRITWWKTEGSPTDKTDILVRSGTEAFIISHLDSYESYTVQITNINGEVFRVIAGIKTDPSPSPQPTGLVLKTTDVDNSSSKVVVSWDASSVVSGPEIEGYIVVICPAEDNETVIDESGCQTRNVSASNTTAEFEYLEKFVDYDVEVRSYMKHEGRVIEGEAAKASIITGPPSIPSVRNLELTVSSTDWVHVSWSEPVGLERYRVVYNVRVYLSGSKTDVFRLDVNETETTLIDLEHLTNYTVQVLVCLVTTAKRQCGEPESNDFQTLSGEEPRNVRVHVINSTSLTVTWDGPSPSSEPEEVYKITWWRAGATSNETTQSTNSSTLVAADSGVLIITGLEPYENYVVQVSRKNGEQGNVWETKGVRVTGATDPAPSPQPTGLALKAFSASTSSSAVTVSWNRVPQASGPPVRGYLVTICPVGGNSERRLKSECLIRNTTTSELTVVFEDLKKFTDYVVEVWAYVEHDGRVINGEVTTAKVSTDPPEIPAVDDLKLSVSNQSVAHVSWRRPAGLDEYQVVYIVKVISKTSEKEILEVSVNETQLTLFNLTYWTDYTVRVLVCIVRTARRSCGGSDGVDFQTLVKTICYSTDPREPGNIRVSVVNSTSLSVSWDKPSLPGVPVEGYHITWWKAGETANASKTSFVPEDASTFIITNLEPYQKYIVQVVRADGDSNDTGVVPGSRSEGTTDPSPSPQPDKLTVHSTGTVYSSSNVTVMWAPPRNAQGPPVQGYIVAICRTDEDAKDQEASRCKSTNTTSTTWIFQGLSMFVDYIVEIRAYVVYNGRVIEGETRTALVSTDPGFVPEVTNVTPETSNGSFVHVTWQKPAGLERYSVVYNVSVYETTSQKTVLLQDVNETEAHLTGLREGANYTVAVSTCLVRPTRRRCGESSSAVFQTPQGSQNKPTQLKVKAVNSSALEVTWHRPKRSSESSPDGYRITWREADEPSSEEAEVTSVSGTALLPGEAESFVISNLEPYRKYDVNVSGLSTKSSVPKDIVSVSGQGETHPLPSPEPKDLSVERVFGNKSSSKIVVKWSPPDGKLKPPVDGYLVVICRVVEGESSHGKSDCRTAKTSAHETRSVFEEERGLPDYVVEVRAFVEHDCETIEGEVSASF